MSRVRLTLSLSAAAEAIGGFSELIEVVKGLIKTAATDEYRAHWLARHDQLVTLRAEYLDAYESCEFVEEAPETLEVQS